MTKKLIIAIDGPVGSGKSTVARRVAELLGYLYVDTGAMYRALALKASHEDVPADDPAMLGEMVQDTRVDLEEAAGGVRVLLDGQDVSEEIRSPEISQAASMIAQVPAVRRQMVEQQRRAGQRGGVVMEGRDIGTVVFPDAGLKIFLTATPEIRAWRRLRNHQARGEALAFEEMLEEIHLRDRRDQERVTSPLVRAEDAVLVDSSAMEMEEVARLIVMLAEEKQAVGNRQ